MIERIIIFGASGDLTRRLLMPGLAQLTEEKTLPPKLKVVGSATDEWSTEDFRRHIESGLNEHASGVSSKVKTRGGNWLTVAGDRKPAGRAAHGGFTRWCHARRRSSR